MKLHHTETEVHGSSNIEMTGFRIATSAKAFRILSSNLYKYKVRAIIRELSCNAVDGHIALSKTGVDVSQTFDVTIPTPLTEYFSVRDYGIGMSHEDIMGLYTTYFASTKSDSNDYVGALGLGSKSPFSYTDSFTISSWFDGMKRVYTAFIKDGEPNIVKTYESVSDEPSGVEINVPVFDNFDEWSSEARRVYASFDEYTPKFVNKNIQFTKIKSGLNRDSEYSAGVYAVMGGVVYPIPLEFHKNRLISLHSRYAYFIKFEMGELDITPSREELSLDEDTIEKLNSRMDAIEAGDYAKIDEILAKDIDIRIMHREIGENLPIGTWGVIGQRVVHGKKLSEWTSQFDRGYIDNMIAVNHDTRVSRKRCIRTRWSFSGTINPHRIMSMLAQPVPCIIDDLTSNSNRVIEGIIKLGELKARSVVGYIFKDDVALDIYVSSWHSSYKPKVIRLSEWKDKALAIMKSTAPRQVSQVNRNPNVIKWVDGVSSEIFMSAKDIRDGKLDMDWIKIDSEYAYFSCELKSLATSKTLCEISKANVYMLRSPLYKAACEVKQPIGVEFIIDIVKSRKIDCDDVGIDIPRWVYRFIACKSNKNVKIVVDEIMKQCMLKDGVNVHIKNAFSFLLNSKDEELLKAILEYTRTLNELRDICKSNYMKIYKENALIIHAIDTGYITNDERMDEIAKLFVIS